MAWTTPKTDWVGTDTFNASDWLRIVGNLKYITDSLGIAYTPFVSVTDGDTVIEDIAVALHSTWNRGVVKPRVDYGSTWGSRELNVIEKTIEDFGKQIDGTLTENCDRYSDAEIISGDTVSVGLL